MDYSIPASTADRNVRTRRAYSLNSTQRAFLAPIGIFLLHRWPLLFTTFRAKRDPRADLIWLILLSGFGVMLSLIFASNPAHLVDDPTPLMLWIGLAIFVAFFLPLARIVWRLVLSSVDLMRNRTLRDLGGA